MLMLIPVYVQFLAAGVSQFVKWLLQETARTVPFRGIFFTFILGRHYYYLGGRLVIHYKSPSPKCEGTEVSKMG